MNWSKTLLTSLALLSTFGVQTAMAEGPWMIRAGLGVVAPNDDSDGVIGDNGLGLISGNDGVTVDDGYALAFTVSYAFNDNWAATLLASSPFNHDIDGDGALTGLPVGETDHLPPTLAAEYRFSTESAFRPYIGAGINYTIFFDESTTDELTGALDSIVGGVTSTDLKLDDSIGPAAYLGFDWLWDDRWGMYASVWYIDIDTEADVIVNGATVTTVDVDIDPWVFTTGLSYRF